MKWLKDRFWQVVAVVGPFALIAWRIVAALIGKRRAERRAAAEMVKRSEAEEAKAELEDKQAADEQVANSFKDTIQELRDANDDPTLSDLTERFKRPR